MALSPKELALTDLAFFASEYPLNLRLWEVQKFICDAIQQLLETPAEGQPGHKLGLIVMGPPDIGKTSRVSVPLIPWLLARNKSFRVIVASAKDNYAQQITGSAARRIESNHALQEDFGVRPAWNSKWADDEYHVQRPNQEDKDASILAVGAQSEIISQRGDLLLCDDLCTKRNSVSEAQRQALKTWFDTDFDSRLDRPHGKIVVLGHSVHKADLYGELLKREDWMKLELKAIVSDLERAVLVPEKQNYEALCRKRANDFAGFNMFHQQQPMEDGIYVSLRACEGVRDLARPLYRTIPDHVRVGYQKIVLAIDPAFSENRWSKKTAITVWGYKLMTSMPIEGQPQRDPWVKRDLLDAFYEKTSPEGLEAVCIAKILAHKPDIIALESNMAQVLLVPMLKRGAPAFADRLRYEATTGKKGDVALELAGLFELVNKGIDHVSVPYADVEGRAASDSFFTELREFQGVDSRGGYKDFIMSWYIAEKAAGQLKGEEFSGFVHPTGVVGAVSRARWGSGLPS